MLIPVRGLVFEFGLLHLLAFAGALLSVTVVYRLSRISSLAPLTSLLLTGLRRGVAARRRASRWRCTSRAPACA